MEAMLVYWSIMSQMFRKYLEESGVLEATTKALSKIHLMDETERPEDPIQFIIKVFI